MAKKAILKTVSTAPATKRTALDQVLIATYLLSNGGDPSDASDYAVGYMDEKGTFTNITDRSQVIDNAVPLYKISEIKVATAGKISKKTVYTKVKDFQLPEDGSIVTARLEYPIGQDLQFVGWVTISEACQLTFR